MKLLKTGIIIVCLAAAPAMAADLSITQKNQTFSQPDVTVHVGDSLHFHNDDTVNHNITVRGEDTDDLGLQKPGAMVSYKFDTKGSYRVICSIHPRMKMNVTVQ